MARNKFKRRRAKSSGKTISAHQQPKESDNKKHPLFGFEHLDKKFCISKCNKDEQAGLADTFRKLGSMTWNDIRLSNRHASGYEKIPATQLKGSLPAHVTEDTHVIAFRFLGKKAMVGYKEGAVFQLLKVDRNYTVYKH